MFKVDEPGLLEKLLRDKQDQLRGRPEDWIDRFGSWRRRTDWIGITIVTVWVALCAITVIGILQW